MRRPLQLNPRRKRLLAVLKDLEAGPPQQLGRPTLTRLLVLLLCLLAVHWQLCSAWPNSCKLHDGLRRGRRGDIRVVRV
jgi:hypothetical protein